MKSALPITYTSYIDKVHFVLSGQDEAEADSYLQVTNHELYKGNRPADGGVSDLHMGTYDREYNCQTCHLGRDECLGHEGHYIVKYPVINPHALPDIGKLLKVICFNCGRPILKDSELAQMPIRGRLDAAQKAARTKPRVCIHCEKPHPVVAKDPDEPLAFTAEYLKDKKQVDKRRIFPHDMERIFGKILPETVAKLGINPKCHPRKYVLRAIKVPPVSIRPDQRKGTSRSSDNDLTSMIQIIVKKSEDVPGVLPEVIDDNTSKLIYELNSAYYEFVKASNEGSLMSLGKRQKGKRGRQRRTQLGKRVRICGRSTITCDPTMRLDEITIPLLHARILQVCEIVQPYNKARLMTYVQNGRDQYPGCTSIIKAATGVTYTVKSALENEIELEPGDIVNRDMITGDYVGFNRQPSLASSNITTVRVIVCLDPTILTYRMNVLLCPFFDADFDGDQMSIYVYAEEWVQNETSQLSSSANWLLSFAFSTILLGQTEDSIVGNMELTMTGTVLDRFHAMLAFQNSTYFPSLSYIEDFTVEAGMDVAEAIRAGKYKGGITGRELASRMLDETPISYRRDTTYYAGGSLSAWIKYHPDDITLRIVNGKIQSGVLDKASIGKKATGGIYHIIASEYGTAKALEVMYNMQQLAIGYTYQHGFTMGILDLMISEEAQQKIAEISADIINESRLIVKKLDAGEIIPPIGKTVDDYYEEQQINALKTFERFNEPVLMSVDHKTNGLVKMILSGSKGALENMFNMVSSVGQKIINGKRVDTKLGYKRAMVFFPRFDETPAARGYIASSYMSGMNSVEYFSNAINSRFDIITKALSTSVTGDQYRMSAMNLGGAIVNNMRWVVKGDIVVQLVYGEDFMDSRYLERVKFPTVAISDADFKAKYSHDGYPEFFKRMTEDRARYRESCLRVERMNVRELFQDSQRMPVNVERVIESVIHNSSMYTQGGDLDEKVKLVEELCRKAPYWVLNDVRAAAGAAIPAYITEATWWMVMLIRSYLHPNALDGLSLDMIQAIGDKIRVRYIRALVDCGAAVGVIAAQSFSSPLTQYMLDAHRRSATGGTSTNSMTKCREITSARDVDKLEAPSMLLPVAAEYATDRAKVQEIANNIEVIKLRQFVDLVQIFYEKFAAPVHPAYVGEKAFIDEFLKMNPLIKPPVDLVRWCVRLTLSKTAIVLKNMSIDTLVRRLREVCPDLFIIYTPENAPTLYLRVYMRAGIKDARGDSVFKNRTEEGGIRAAKDMMLDIIIRGVDRILNTRVVEMIRSRVTDTGAVERVKGVYGIVTDGTNLSGLLTNKYLDINGLRTDAIMEVYRMYGIEAARQTIASELRTLVEGVNHRHYLMYANEMTRTGVVTKMVRSGPAEREPESVLLRTGFSSPLVALTEAAINGMTDQVNGVIAPLLLGAIPRCGTAYNECYVNEKIIRENLKRPDDYLDALLL